MHYRVRKAKGHLTFGTGDPAMTGAAGGVIRSVLPAGASHFELQPVFHDRMLDADMMLEGRGAGDAPTASAIVGDIIQAAQNAVHPMPYMQENPKPVADDWYSRYFIRMKAKDEPGVLAEVTGKMAKHGISVSAMMQKDADAAK